MAIWAAGFFIAFVTALAMTRVMIKIGIGDRPDAERKLHTKTTPTSGGVGIVIGVFAGFGYVWSQSDDGAVATLLACVIFALVAGLLGLLDDIFVLGPKAKLIVMLTLATSFCVFFVNVKVLSLMPTMIVSLHPFIGIAGTIFWLLVMVNCVNFMDGANGLSMGCCAIGLAGLSGLLAMEAQNLAALLAWVSVAGCCGFLVWNAGKGAIFAGDSGALFVGFLCAALGAYSVTKGVNPLLVALCFLPLLVDAIFTIVRRIKYRENILTPHAHHAYQRAIRAGASHAHTASRYWVQSGVCVCAAFFGEVRGNWTPLLCFLVMLAVLTFIYVRTLRITEPSLQ